MKYVYLLLFLTNFVLSEEEQKLKVSLYYESLCPYCVNFIKNQLYPVYNELGKYLDLDLEPYGHTNMSSTIPHTFRCQHGKNECIENMIQGCIVTSNYTQLQKLQFVSCYVGQPVRNAKLCAERFGISTYDVKHCLSSKWGYNVMIGFASATKALQPPLGGVPDIRFNNKFDPDMEKRARADFFEAACSFLDVPECK